MLDKISVSDVFRYVLSGFLLLCMLALYDLDQAKAVFEAIGTLGFTGTVLASGTLFYVWYRALVYNTLIIRAKDLWHSIIGTESYRMYLQAKFKGLTTAQAQWFYTHIRDADAGLRKKLDQRAVWAAHIHYTYMSAIMGLILAVARLCANESPNGMAWNWFAIISVVSFLAAFSYDGRFEDDELAWIRQVDENLLKTVHQGLFGA